MRFVSTGAGVLAAALTGCAPTDGALAERPITVGVDATHDNRHTLEGSYRVFGEVVSRRAPQDDRRVVVRSVHSVDPLTLMDLDVLVVASPTTTVRRQEVLELDTWVRTGGSLFLVVDHAPYPGVARNLAGTFGFGLIDGWLHNDTRTDDLVLSREAGTLLSHALTDGPHGTVDTIAADAGAAFNVPRMATVVGEVPAGWKMNLPDLEVNIDAEGLALLAALEVGAGRVVVCGEASMLTCQGGLWDPEAARGLCEPGREDQAELAANAVFWLATGEDPAR